MLTDQAHPEDWAAIESLLTRCGLPSADLSPGSLVGFLVVRQDGALVGVVGLEDLGGVAMLRSLAVEEGYRRMGFASQLTGAAERAARGKQARVIYLLTTTAEGFFARHGYQSVPRDSLPDAIQATTEYRDLCPKTAVCMKKDLSAA